MVHRNPVNHQGRLYLAVPYSERKAAKAAGALWDKTAKSWYAGDTADRSRLIKWLPDQVTVQQTPALSPREEFAEAMRELGCLVTGHHPVMDGTTHRIATTGDKPHEKAGFYVGHLDGHPGGYIENNRTGEKMKWKAKGYSLSEVEKAQLQAESAAKQQAREAAHQARQDQVARSVRALLAVAPIATSDHPYLQSKQARPGDLQVVPKDSSGLPANAAILIGLDAKDSKVLRESNPDKLVFTAGDLLLAAQDINGEIRSVQTIQPNGLKRFAAGGAKQDTFHVVGGQGLDALAKAPAIVIAEGYATADTLSQSLGYATVAAFDAGNLPSVARLLHNKFPDKPFIIAGDNDLHQELTEGRNPGKEKAQAAANAVNGLAIFPIFAPGEQAYPADLKPITPGIARSGNLSDEQKAAITTMKSFTDFNDLATKSVLGMSGVERQVIPLVNSLIIRNQPPIEIKHQQASVVKVESQPVQRKAVNR
ncbi:MAG: toprim domain-containing protein [Methylococcaceae bacterium]|nr:toprim domain-containing protein [Methylococcaceae bacterium]